MSDLGYNKWVLKMIKSLVFPILFSILFSCSAKKYPINIPQKSSLLMDIIPLARSVNLDFPADYDVSSHAKTLYYRQAVLQGGLSLNLSKKEKIKYEKERKYVEKTVLKKNISIVYETKYKGKRALHEITAGVINMPFKKFLAGFDPASKWGKSLAKYKGGQLKIDRFIGENPQFLRERMVLGTPWYAIGAPDMDMSKYEAVEYTKDSVTVYWQVKYSENRSVFLDIGYVKFKKYMVGGQEKSMVLFNSIHRVDAGWGAALMPGFLVTWLSKKTLGNLFSDHIDNYRDLLTK
jgi:hypothetical protein